MIAMQESQASGHLKSARHQGWPGQEGFTHPYFKTLFRDCLSSFSLQVQARQWESHPNGPEIKVKREPEVPSTSSQHLSCPQRSHGRGAIIHPPIWQGQQSPQHHSVGTWQIHNWAQVCLTPLPTLLQPHHVQNPETSLQGQWTSEYLEWLWVDNTHSWNYSGFSSLTSVSSIFFKIF